MEEGQLQKKEGRWEYAPSEDPGLKYLFLKGIITQDEYDKGLKVMETKERIVKPNFNIDVNNGLNIRVGSKFLLKMRLLTQVRYSYSTYNDAWGTVGDSRNQEILGGQVEFRAVKHQSDSSVFTVPRTRLQFMGYAFDPDLRYNISWQMDQAPFNQEGGSGRVALQDAYLASWHIPCCHRPGRPTAGLVQSRPHEFDRHVNLRGQYDCPESVCRQPGQQS